MPSRKKGSRKGSRKGLRKGSRKGSPKPKNHFKRSLRFNLFSPKLVIRERTDTIEDTINTVIGKITHRIPTDISNIIQGYEGAEPLYFSVDPQTEEFIFSNKTPFRDGEKTYEKTDGSMSFNEPYTYFIRVKVIIPYIYNNNPKITERYVLLAGITNTTNNDVEEYIENYVLEKYHRQFVNDLRNSFIGDVRFRGATRPRVRTEIDHSITYPFNIEDNNHNEIIFEKVI